MHATLEPTKITAQQASAALADMDAKAEEAAALLSRMANPQRLRILCLMVEGERSVSEIVTQTGLAQPTVSQHLKKLRDAEIVRTRRDAQTIYYSLYDTPTIQVLQTLYAIFCASEASSD